MDLVSILAIPKSNPNLVKVDSRMERLGERKSLLIID